MRKSSAPQNSTEFFNAIKQYMKLKDTDILQIDKLRQYQHTHQQNILQSIITYLDTKSKFSKSMPNDQCAEILRGFLSQSKVWDKNFSIDSVAITYISKYRIKNAQQLLATIKNNPQGILVDDQLLKFTTQKIRELISSLINERKIIAVRSRGIDKAKDKQENYEGYYLMPFPPQLEDSFSYIFKTSAQQLKKQNNNLESRQKQPREQKMQKIYQTKTAAFRAQFESVCSANINKGQQKVGQTNNGQSFQKIYNNWNPINKMSVPNFQVSAEEWFKNRKV